FSCARTATLAMVSAAIAATIMRPLFFLRSSESAISNRHSAMITAAAAMWIAPGSPAGRPRARRDDWASASATARTAPPPLSLCLATAAVPRRLFRFAFGLQQCTVEFERRLDRLRRPRRRVQRELDVGRLLQLLLC